MFRSHSRRRACSAAVCVLRRSALGNMHTAAALICKHAPCVWHAGTLLLRANGLAATPALFHGHTTCTLHYQSLWHGRRAAMRTQAGCLPSPYIHPTSQTQRQLHPSSSFPNPAGAAAGRYLFKTRPANCERHVLLCTFPPHGPPLNPFWRTVPPHVSLRLFGPFPLHFSCRRAWLRPPLRRPPTALFCDPHVLIRLHQCLLLWFRETGLPCRPSF